MRSAWLRMAAGAACVVVSWLVRCSLVAGAVVRWNGGT